MDRHSPARRLRLAAALAVALVTPGAAADPPAAADDVKVQARSRYLDGVALVQKVQWSDALAAFEASAKLYPNAATTMNIGACERALGRYVRARATLQRALSESVAAGGSLPESSVAEATGFISEIDRVLARVSVTLEPASATIAVDGRPLAVQAGDGASFLAAGVLPPGPGAPAPSSRFDLVLDPGTHVITLSRKGFTDAVVNRTFAPGSRSALELKLDLLPATIRVTASQPGALVKVGDRDVGPAPVDVLRPAGAYRVVVEKKGFLPYTAQVAVKPGEETKLRATLLVDEPSVLSRWWFWTGAAAVVAGGVVLTYALTRPEPQPPAYDGGNTGWVVQPSAVRF